MIIAIDFDGTIVTHEYPEIGTLIPGAKETIQALRENGHKCFLWTMRGHVDSKHRVLEEARDFLEKNDINLDGINRSPAQFSTSPKQYANIYIDDAAMGCPMMVYKGKNCVDWLSVAYYLGRMGLINLEQYRKIVKICKP